MILNGSVTNGVRAPVRRDVISSRPGAAWSCCGVAVACARCRRARASCRWSGCLPRRICRARRLRGVKISPDGKLIAYLRARDDDKDRFDLWAYDVAAKRDRLLVDSRTLAGADRALSAEEEARRERQRTCGLLRHRRIQLRARQPPAADPAQRRPVRLRPGAQARRRGAPADHDGRLTKPMRASRRARIS